MISLHHAAISRLSRLLHLQLPYNIANLLYNAAFCYYLFFWLTFPKFFTGCHSEQDLSRLYVMENTTLFANDSVLTGVIDNGRQKIYTLQAGKCVAEGLILVVAFETFPIYSVSSEKEQTTEGYFSVMVNTLGHIPLSGRENGTFVANAGTWNPALQSCGPFTEASNELRCRQSYAALRIPLAEARFDSFPWHIGVSSVGTSSRFRLRAWCLDGEANQGEDLQQNKQCVRVGTTRCMENIRHTFCAADEISLTSSEGRTLMDGLSVDYGDWKYFTFDVFENQTRILVEMSRAHGDVILFLKPEHGGNKPGVLPSEFDIDEYADKYNYQNRLRFHHRSLIGTGRFYIGVFNNDACVEEASSFNLTISTASLQGTNSLCPVNCSYPNGKCIADNICHCEKGYGGSFCEGSLESPKSRQKITGRLLPGEIAYFQLDHKGLDDHNKVAIKFARNGSNTVLLAKDGGFPTLTNYSMKFADIVNDSNLSYLLEEHRISSDDFLEDLIFAVFNVDFMVHQSSIFDIIIVIPGGKGLSSWVILIAALCSSLSVCLFAVILKAILWRACRGDIDQANDLLDNVLNQEGGLEKAVIARFPLLPFEEGIVPKDEAACSICLSEYIKGDTLRRLPICFHVFHVDCVEKWLHCNLSCPLCRALLVGHKNEHDGCSTTEVSAIEATSINVSSAGPTW